MEKLDGKSMDIVAENIAKLKSLFPDIFSEGKIDFEALKATLGEYVDESQERYSFNWSGKAKSRRIAQTPSTGTLRPAKEESKDWDSTKNLYIEGDNLEVLKLLQKSYHKRVKMIYIDPPYNTGKDFVYKDNFKDNIKNYLELTKQVDSEGNRVSTNSDTSGRYHSNWLNMIYPRLKLARNLLKDDGVIFISIDDNEVANLRKVCDEVFGEENFVAEIVWEKRFTRSNNAKKFATLTERILLYRKTSLVEELKEPRNDKANSTYSNPDNDPRGVWTSVSYVNPATKDQRPNLYYPLYNPHTKKEVLHPTNAWKYSKEIYEKHMKEDRLYWGKNGENTYPRLKKFLNEMDGGMVPVDLWLHKTTGTTDQASKDLQTLMGKKIFDFPKPIGLILRMMKIGTKIKDDDIILDFFSGSATTAHAVMQLNAEDGGNRRYIMVQLPEPTDPKSEAYKAGYKTIAEIGKERIRRAGENISKSSELDIGFKVFKLDSSNIKTWDPDYENLEESLLDAVENIKPDRTEEDLLYEILLKYGLDLAQPIEELVLTGKKVFIISSGALVVCLDEQITLDTVEEIAKLTEKYETEETMRVVFRDNGFKNAEVKTNAIQILKQYGIEDVKSV